VELTLDGMLRRAYAVTHNQSTNIPVRVLSGREWGRQYNSVRVQVPSNDSSRLQLQQDQLIKQNLRRDGNTAAGLFQRGRHVGPGAGHKKSDKKRALQALAGLRTRGCRLCQAPGRGKRPRQQPHDLSHFSPKTRSSVNFRAIYMF
jgi:hypothetical protein